MDVVKADLRPSKLYGSLDPFSPPLGLDPRSCSTEETTFIVKVRPLLFLLGLDRIAGLGIENRRPEG